MFGLGGQEILLLGVCCSFPVGGLVLFLVLQSQQGKRVTELEDENRELRRRDARRRERPDRRDED